MSKGRGGLDSFLNCLTFKFCELILTFGQLLYWLTFLQKINLNALIQPDFLVVQAT